MSNQSHATAKIPNNQALPSNGNGHGAHPFDPAAWQGQVDALIGILPDDLRRTIGNSIAQALRAHVSGSKPRGRFILHSAAEALEPQPPIHWVIDRLFSAGSVSILFGEPGSKKTYALLDAAVCVAHGVKWLDFDTRQAPVLIIDEESGKRRMNRRLGEVLRGHMADGCTPVYYTTLERFQLSSKADELAVESAIEESGAQFVIIDALADIMPGADENAVKDVQPIFLALRGIAERTQAAIVLIHHSNKIGGYRGSTAIKGAVDLLLVAQSKPDDGLINFSFDKARDVEPFKFAAQAIFDGARVYLSAAEPVKAARRLSKAQDYVIGYLKEHGPSLIVDITSHADVCKDTTARSAMYSLAALELIKRVDEGGPGTVARYDLTEKGRKMIHDRLGRFEPVVPVVPVF